MRAMVVHFVVATAPLACSGNEDGRSSQGASPGGLKACAERSSELGACIIEPPGFTNTAFEAVSGLIVVGQVPANPSECTHMTPIHSSPPTKLNARDSAAWSMTDENGDTWTLVAAIHP